MARRILNRKDMRADFDAAEQRKKEEEERDDDEEEEDDEEGDEDDEEDEEGEGDGEEAEPSDEGDEEAEGDEDDEERPKPKKKKKPAKEKAPKAPKKTRSRAAKVVRQRVVWGVFNNSHQCVATYEYPRTAEAVQHAARLMQDKKSTHFIQPVKEPWEDREKKTDKKEK